MLEKKKKIFKSKQVFDRLAKWLIILGYRDLRRPRVCRRSNVGLVQNGDSHITNYLYDLDLVQRLRLKKYKTIRYLDWFNYLDN